MFQENEAREFIISLEAREFIISLLPRRCLGSLCHLKTQVCVVVIWLPALRKPIMEGISGSALWLEKFRTDLVH